MTNSALLESEAIQEDARGVGFGWPLLQDLFLKMHEEMEEVREAVEIGDRDAIEDEVGDLIFVAATIAHFCQINPDQALRRANKKFITRFRLMEQMAAEKQHVFADLSLQEKELLWQKAKKQLNNA